MTSSASVVVPASIVVSASSSALVGVVGPVVTVVDVGVCVVTGVASVAVAVVVAAGLVGVLVLLACVFVVVASSLLFASSSAAGGCSGGLGVWVYKSNLHFFFFVIPPISCLSFLRSLKWIRKENCTFKATFWPCFFYCCCKCIMFPDMSSSNSK